MGGGWFVLHIEHYSMAEETSVLGWWILEDSKALIHICLMNSVLGYDNTYVIHFVQLKSGFFAAIFFFSSIALLNLMYTVVHRYACRLSGYSVRSQSGWGFYRAGFEPMTMFHVMQDTFFSSGENIWNGY